MYHRTLELPWFVLELDVYVYRNQICSNMVAELLICRLVIALEI